MVDEFKLDQHWINYSKSINLEDEIKNATKPLIIYFSAKWCGPCKLFSPILEEKLVENKNFKVIKVEADKFEDEAMAFEVPGLPSFFLYHKGAKIETYTGSKDDLMDRIYAKIVSLQ